MSAPSRLEISVLGTFSIRMGSVEIRIQSRKACALIGYLALADSHEAARETLLGLLWSESPESNARASLRQVVHEAQSAFLEAGFTGLHSDRLMLRLSPASVCVDLFEVTRLAKEGHAHPKLFVKQRATETLLRDFEAIDPAFREWLTARRQTLHERLIAELTASFRRLPPGSNQLELARAILNLDPTHEEAARNIIRAQASNGDVGGALRVYKNLWDRLDTEFDVEPAKETQELIAAIKLGQPVAAAALETPRTVVVAQSPQTGSGRPSVEQLENFIRTLVSPYGGRLTARESSTYVLEFPDPRAAVQAALGIHDVGRGPGEQICGASSCGWARTHPALQRRGAHPQGRLRATWPCWRDPVSCSSQIRCATCSRMASMPSSRTRAIASRPRRRHCCGLTASALRLSTSRVRRATIFTPLWQSFHSIWKASTRSICWSARYWRKS